MFPVISNPPITDNFAYKSNHIPVVRGSGMEFQFVIFLNTTYF